jgi:hypothetical protein
MTVARAAFLLAGTGTSNSARARATSTLCAAGSPTLTYLETAKPRVDQQILKLHQYSF